MAIRERAGRKSPWQVYWNNPITGKRESENFLTKKEAEKHDSLVKHRIKFDRESFKKDENETETESAHGITLETCFIMYARSKGFSKKDLSPMLSSMRIPLRDIGGEQVSALTKMILEKLMKSMQDGKTKPVTIRGRMSILRTVLRWAEEQGLAQKIDFPRLPPAHYEHFVPPTREELSLLLQVASPHIFRMIVLGSQMGVRIGPCEISKLTWNDVDFDRHTLRVHGSKKNARCPWREVPIRESLRPLFQVWYDEDKQIGVDFIVHWRRKPVASFKTAWSRTLKKAGIERRIRPYDLRHAFATEAIAAGVDIGTVANLMGHNSPTMILTHYQHVMDSQKRSAVEVLPDIFHVSKSMCPKEEAATCIQ